MAGLAYGLYHQLEVEEAIKYGIAASSFTILGEEIVRSDLTTSRVEDMIKELGL